MSSLYAGMEFEELEPDIEFDDDPDPDDDDDLVEDDAFRTRLRPRFSEWGTGRCGACKTAAARRREPLQSMFFGLRRLCTRRQAPYTSIAIRR